MASTNAPSLFGRAAISVARAIAQPAEPPKHDLVRLDHLEALGSALVPSPKGKDVPASQLAMQLAQMQHAEPGIVPRSSDGRAMFNPSAFGADFAQKFQARMSELGVTTRGMSLEAAEADAVSRPAMVSVRDVPKNTPLDGLVEGNAHRHPETMYSPVKGEDYVNLAQLAQRPLGFELHASDLRDLPSVRIDPTPSQAVEHARGVLGPQGLKTYGDLSPLQKQLLGGDGPQRWATELNARQKECFLVLTHLWEHPETVNTFNAVKDPDFKPYTEEQLAGLRLTPKDLEGITLAEVNTDKKHFELRMQASPEAITRLTEATKEGNSRGMVHAIPWVAFHPATQAAGGRMPFPQWTSQIMLSDPKAGIFDADLDKHLPERLEGEGKGKAFLRHWFKHWGEIIGGKNNGTDYMRPDKVARSLDDKVPGTYDAIFFPPAR
ncbi:MAG: hypothetical protein K1X89_08505 [Myxococcaceae bacterium]|nr:hypothetical protein [Myxococcaceae bacterium]